MPKHEIFGRRQTLLKQKVICEIVQPKDENVGLTDHIKSTGSEADVFISDDPRGRQDLIAEN